MQLDDFLSALQLSFSSSLELESIARENKRLFSDLSSFDPLQLASTFAGLLTAPELQSNCVRLEILVHLALAFGQGHRKPNTKIISRLFEKLGEGITGRYEDPAEDVFVSSIATPRGNFRILEGVWESAGFFTQRLMNALELIPSSEAFDHIRDNTYALLKLSDVVCERAELVRYQLGNDTPIQKLSGKFANSVSFWRKLIKFTSTDLAAHGISIERLAAFNFNLESRAELLGEKIGNSSLERFPVAHRNGVLFLLLSTAVSAALRRYVLREMETLGVRDIFAKTLAYEYSRLFSGTPLLGKYKGVPIEFRQCKNGILASILIGIDTGLYVNFVFIVDTLEAFEDSEGLIGIYPAHSGNSNTLKDSLAECIGDAYKVVGQATDFRGGLTLIVGCGMGRAGVYPLPKMEWQDWRIESISASDLLSLCWLPDFDALSLWKLLDNQEHLKKLGVELHNINGLLNMIGWARSHGGNLVPHDDLPENFGKTGKSIVVIEQNSLRNVRHEIMSNTDPHVAQYIDGSWIKVRKYSQSVFEEDKKLPFFIMEEKLEGHGLLGVFETASRAWWCELEPAEGASEYEMHERFKMLNTWLCRTAPILERVLPTLPDHTVLWRMKFEGRIGGQAGNIRKKKSTFNEAKESITLQVDRKKKIVLLIANPEFEDAIFHSENIAERALVARLIEGFFQISLHKFSSSELDELVYEAAGNINARQTHAFMAKTFRDFVQDTVWRTPIAINEDDMATSKLGLGWRVRNRELGGNIQGKEECTSFLNAVVRYLEDTVCKDLKQLNRRSVVFFALKNYESAARERTIWHRTSAALMALHKDQQAILQAIAEQDAKWNAIFQSSRLLIEFALCESPIVGGRKSGQLDMSRLMAKIMMIFEIGGWSEAIRWEAIEPRVYITPLGDVRANLVFYKNVMSPYGRTRVDSEVHEAIDTYAENVEEPTILPLDHGIISEEFLSAFEEEFGVSLECARKFIDYVEDIGIKSQRAILSIKKSELLNITLEDEVLMTGDIASLIEFLTFKGRQRWRDVPDGYDNRDIFPWRFRRRLNVLRKPLIQINEEADPTILVAPGMLREAFVYMTGNYYRGDFPRWQLKPKMRKWAGASRDRIGREFTLSVAKRLSELGWKTESEVAVTKLLRKGFGKENYGDIDVLAWKPDTGRVLLIECKDVIFSKNHREIAEQLADFKGELKADGKKDQLLKHLDRIEIVSTHESDVKKYIGLSRPLKIEGYLVFKNPVPMKFDWDRMKNRVGLHFMSELESI